jgi:hypothetical protein
MTLRRITRTQRLSPQEAAKYREVREQVAEELPELITRHHERLIALAQVKGLVQELKTAREEKGLSLSDLTRPSKPSCVTRMPSVNAWWSLWQSHDTVASPGFGAISPKKGFPE